LCLDVALALNKYHFSQGLFPVIAHILYILPQNDAKSRSYDIHNTHSDDANREMANVHHQFERGRPKVCVRLHSLGKKWGRRTDGRAGGRRWAMWPLRGRLPSDGLRWCSVRVRINQRCSAVLMRAHPYTLRVHCIPSALAPSAAARTHQN
jgi:hypothetical protein